MRTQSDLNISMKPKYPHKSVERVMLIKHAQKLGFDLAEIREFLAFWDKGN